MAPARGAAGGDIVLFGVIADRSWHAGRSAAALPRTEPRPIGMGLADPSAVVASRTALHDQAYRPEEGFAPPPVLARN
jgi:hypothetical protein